jgi:IS5 family transposase
MMLGLEILKHIRKGLSDESLVKSLQSDMVVMRFCGIENIYDESRIIDSSSMTKFRNRISAVP